MGVGAFGWEDATLAEGAFLGSIDEAKALHEAVLPENCYWWIENRPDGRQQAGVTVGNLGRAFKSEGDDPARAWLIAILKALIAEAQPAPPPTQEGLDL
jgi:hypothetical protein